MPRVAMARARRAWGVALVAATFAGGRKCAAQDSVRTTRLIGHVLDSLGAPVTRAEVTVLPRQLLKATTNDSGFFVIDSIPVGRVQLSVRRLGYAPATFTAQLRANVIERVTLRLASVAFELPSVAVADTVEHPWLRVFERRRQSGHGVFFTRQDIVRSQVRTLTDILRRVPGISLQRERQTGEQRVVFTEGQMGGHPCTPQIFVHMMDYSGQVDDFVPDDIEAMEVYPSITQVPAELQTGRAQYCGAIVIWTREPPPAAAKKKGG